MGVPVAHIGQGFGMRVTAWSPNLTPERAAAHGAECVSKSELFAGSDVVSIHMPLSSRTEGLVGAEELRLMKRDAFLINTARSEIVDQSALVFALRNNHIGGAGIDVFDMEPLPSDHPYRVLPNVVATPHIGFVTEENYSIFFEESVENLLAYLDGSPIRRITAANPFLPDSQVAQQMKQMPHR